MDAMTMPYRVEDPRVLANLKPGERIGFTLVVGKSSSYISNVHVLEYDSMERDPAQVRRLTILDEAMRAKAGLLYIEDRRNCPGFFADRSDRERAVSLSEFRGKVVAITFIYTRCPLPDDCIRLSNNFAQLQKRFQDRLNRDLVLLSVYVRSRTRSARGAQEICRAVEGEGGRVAFSYRASRGSEAGVRDVWDELLAGRGVDDAFPAHSGAGSGREISC